MAVRERRLPRTQQPQDGAKLDLSNALTRGLLWSYDYAGRSLGGVAHAVTYRSGYGRRVGSQGIAVEPNVANAGFTFDVPDTTLDEFTLVIVADLPSRASPSSSGPLVGVSTHIGVAAYAYDYGLDLLSRAYYAPDYNGTIEADMPGIVPASGRCVIVQTYRRNSYLRNYVNGQYINGATPLDYPARWGGGAYGSEISVGSHRAQTIGVQATWLQAASLDDEEARRVSGDPWQLFEPQRIWVPVSAGSGTTVTPDAGVLTLAGLTPAVTVDHLLRPSTGVLALEGQAPTVVVGANVQPSTGALTFEGLAPTAVATDNHVAAPAPGAATLTGLAPTVVATDHHTVEPSAGALTLAGLQPAAVTGGNVVAQPEPGALVLAGLQPTIAASDNRSAQPSAGELALTGLAPTVTVTENVIVNPLTGALIFTGLAPTVLVSDNRVVQPGAGALSFEGLVPEIPVSSPTVEPGVGALALEGLAPTVVTTGAESVATDPKLIARWPNVRVDFGTRKKTPEPTPAPAKITNMPGHPPVPRPLAGGLLAALDSLPPAPPASPKAAPAPVKTLAPTPAPTAAPTQSLAPPAPAAAPAVVPAPLVPTPVPVAAGITPEQMTALLQRMDALSEGMSSRLVEVNKGLQADIERVTQLLEAERDARLAREKRELNEARAKEITARLLGSGG